MSCIWPVSYAACTNTDALDNMEASVEGSGSPLTKKEFVEKLATDFLWNWTGRSFGLCAETIRPCQEQQCADTSATQRFLSSLVDGSYSTPWQPVLLEGKWYNITCGSCAGKCGPHPNVSIRLPKPTHAVTEVRIDGVPLPEESYFLNGNILVRTDGQAWPKWQDLSLVPGSIGTWEIDLDFGLEVPVGGQIAAGILALEFAKAICNDNTCQLPKRLSSITRQGVTATFMDNFEDLEKGGTGIWLVDSWVSSVTKPARGGSVYSVDVRRA